MSRIACASVQLGIGLLTLSLVSTAAGCVVRRPPAAQCVFNGDCEERLVCAGGACRAECQTDRDCPTGFACSQSDQLDKRVCLPPDAPRLCVYASHCESLGPHVCSNRGECVPQCTCDYDCRTFDLAARCVALDPSRPASGGGCENNPRLDVTPHVATTCPADDAGSPAIDAPTE